jgi:hypothetical protein
MEDCLDNSVLSFDAWHMSANLSEMLVGGAASSQVIKLQLQE